MSVDPDIYRRARADIAGIFTYQQMAWTGDKLSSLILPCQICERSELRGFPVIFLLTASAYTIVESTTHSIAVDILTSPNANIGTLFVSSGEGTYFVQALADTNRNDYGIVDFEQLVGLEVGLFVRVGSYVIDQQGVAIANVVANREEVVGRGDAKRLRSMITYDDGMSLTWFRG